MSYPARNSLQLLPFWDTLRRYRWAAFGLDLQAGITVAIFAVPQTMAYAMMAGVPPVNGLYAAIVMSIVAALFGSSPYVNTGPSNSAALLTAAALLPLAHHEHLMRVVFLFALMVGVIRLLMGLIRLGTLIDFVPESAFLGFTVAVGTLIAFGQLHHLLGVERPENFWFVARLTAIFGDLGQANLFTVGIGTGVLAIMLALDRYARRFPVALLAIVAAAIVGWAMPSVYEVPLVRDIGSVPARLPGFVLPWFDGELIVQLLPAAFGVAVIGLVEAVSIGQTLAVKNGQVLNHNQEIVGQGVSQIVGAFFQGIPGSGSFGRSTLIEQTGGRTCLANVYFGLATAAAVLAIPGLLNQIPVSALSGLLIYIGYKLVDVRGIARVWATSRSDALVMALTMVTTIFVKLEYGLFIGIAVAAMIYLNRARRLRIYELLPDCGAGTAEVSYEQLDRLRHQPSELVAFSVAGDLFYGISHQLRDVLTQIIQLQEPKYLIFRVRRALNIDYSCWNAIFDVAEELHGSGAKLYLCGVRPDTDRIIDQAGMRHVISRDQVFPAEPQLYKGFENCLHAIFRELPADARLSDQWQRFREQWDGASTVAIRGKSTAGDDGTDDAGDDTCRMSGVSY